MNLCLGILAYNEEDGIAETLADLARQDLWRSGHRCSLLVVPNGCRDATAEIARRALADFPAEGRVEELTRPGKANAWNVLVHDLLPAGTDILLLADADIRLEQPHALRALVEALVDCPEAVAAVDEPLKNLGAKGKKSASDRISLAASALASAGPPKLCGQLYAARVAALRGIFLPEPMLVEDGFIKAMLVTDGFTAPENPQRLVRAPGIWHHYEAETSLRAYVKHEKRILIGTLCNILLFEKAREWVAEGRAVGTALRAELEANPEWFRQLIRTRLGPGAKNRGFSAYLWVPLRQLQRLHGMQRLKALPVALLRTLLNLRVAAAALADLRRDRIRW
jgi:glycosyltransferase involved in cell wall biosynthesis